MSKMIEPAKFRCSADCTASEDGSVVRNRSGGVMRVWLPKGWTYEESKANGLLVISFLCPNCARPADETLASIISMLNSRSDQDLEHLHKLLLKEDPKLNRLTLVPHRPKP
jgi:hypothetical protein